MTQNCYLGQMARFIGSLNGEQLPFLDFPKHATARVPPTKDLLTLLSAYERLCQGCTARFWIARSGNPRHQAPPESSAGTRYGPLRAEANQECSVPLTTVLSSTLANGIPSRSKTGLGGP